MDWENCPAVERKPGKIGGAWAFTGTRVPVYSLFENLASGATVDEFVEWFRDGEKQQVRAVLECEAKTLRESPARWRCCSISACRSVARALSGAFGGYAGREGLV